MSNTKLIRNSTVEFLIFTAQDGKNSIEARYENETIWLTQKLMGELFEVGTNTINYHLKEIFKNSELEENRTVRKFRIVQIEGKRQVTMQDWAKRLDLFLKYDDRAILKNSGKIISKVAKDIAETEFEEYRIVQDRLFESDFDKKILKQLKNGGCDE